MRDLLAAAVIGVLSAGFAAAQDTVYQPGKDIRSPVLIREVKPNYTGDAMRRKLQGVVELTAVVRSDGTVGDVTVKKSLDADLDQEAIKAAKQWRFKPGTKDGEPVNVQVMIELSFTLRDGPRAYRVGDPGITAPVALKRVNAEYTDAARKAHITGVVELAGVVTTDGTITAIRVTKRLDDGLDQEAVKALAQWTFKPGEKDGAPVRVEVQIEMAFNVK